MLVMGFGEKKISNKFILSGEVCRSDSDTSPKTKS
jgi:hypothetical protein